MDLRPTRAIRGPGLGQGELSGAGPRHGGAPRRLRGHIVGADDDLALGNLAERAGILASDPDRATPWLGQPSVVQHHNAGGRTLRRQGGHTLLVEGLGLPRRVGHQRLQAFGRGTRHRGGDGVTVLAWQVRQQPRAVALEARPARRATEERRERLQISGPLRQGVGSLSA
jgi:hypothetical protein